MSEDQGNKRLKIGPAASGEDARDARIYALEHENAHLRQQLLSSNAEVARLRQQLQWRQGNHGALTVNTLTVAVVDLSRINFGLLAQIASFVGTSRELLNLALTCKSFGRRQPASGLDLSLAEEVARQVVSSGRNDVEGARITLSPYVRGRTTWLSILHESEGPLKFDKLLGRGIEHPNGVKTSVYCGSANFCTAVASNYVMESGIHRAEFLFSGLPYIGIVRPMPNLDPDRYASDDFHFFESSLRDDFLAARIDEWGTGIVHACEYNSEDGLCEYTNWAGEDGLDDWEGAEGFITGDKIGMTLDLDDGTLTVYKNDRRLGVMIDGLSGSYCWYVSLTNKEAVTIKHRRIRVLEV